MTENTYSHRLGPISDQQFQAALDRFHLGHFIKAEAIPFGNFGQNIFVSSTTGDYVLRGSPHFWWQFPTEQFFTRHLHEHTSVPVPWPYLIDPTPDIFGWSFVLMPRMPGLQLADQEVKKHLQPAERLGIAQALGANLACMQTATWPSSGRYNPTTDRIEPFDLAQELAWPFPVASDPTPETRTITYAEKVTACLRHHLTRAQQHNPATTTPDDLSWVEELIAAAHNALEQPFQPRLVMEDYKEGNLVVMQQNEHWQVSGVFDLMEAYIGDGEADLSRPIAEYLNEDPKLAGTFFAAYRQHTPLRPGFAARFPIYMLQDRAILWEFFQRQGWRWWPEHWTFRDWASQYTTPDAIFDQL